MDKYFIKDILEKLIKELQANNNIETSELTKGNDITDNDAIYLKNDAEAAFKELKNEEDLIYAPDQIEFRWDSISKGEKLSGECYLTNFAVALNANYLTPNPAVNTINYKNYRYFDDHPYSGDGWIAVYEIGKTISESKLFMFNNDKLYLLTINLRTYIQMLSLSKGFYFWQFLFLHESHSKMASEIFDDLSIKLAALKKLFPQTDISILEEQLKTLKY